MKKILMTLSLALAAIIAVPSAMNAQDVNATKTSQTVCNKSECTKDKKECKKSDKDRKDRKDFKKGKKDRKGDFRCKQGKNGKRRDMRQAGKNPLFNGITLSTEQQQQFKALKEKNASQRQAAKAERQKMDAAKKEARAAEMKAKHEAYDKEIQQILTPEQYKQYQANKEQMAKNKPQKKQKSLQETK